MINSLQEVDSTLNLAFISKEDILHAISLHDIQEFLESLGVSQIELHEDKGFLICPTICHNPLHEAESMKLYWYQNNKIFRCYTECNEAMSIFTLYIKFMDVNYGQKVSYDEAVLYVKKTLQHIITVTPVYHKRFSWDLSKYQFTAHIPQLEEYNENVLDCFSHYYHPSWLGITREVMDKFNIKFSLGQNKIIIPHYDLNGRLIGIRGRAIDPIEAETFGKYRPIQVGEILYTHPLQFNLYGAYEHQQGIRALQSAIIVEGEKSVLLDDVYYGERSNAVACCGSTFNKYHVNILTNLLGASEIVVALDKEYTSWRDSKAKKYREKLINLCKKYNKFASFSYIWDYDNLLDEKDSPYDKGKEVFEELFKNRIKVR